MSTDIKINISLSCTHPDVIQLMYWLCQVFVGQDLRKHFCKDAANFLHGRNSEKYFRVWTGETDNSKSMVLKLTEDTLGQYVFAFPVTIFSNKALVFSSGPNPGLAQAKGAHVGFASEPHTNDDIMAGAIKRITGGDSFFARNCNENGGKTKASHKAILCCNRIPDVADVDKATINRFHILHFPSTWVDHPPETEEEQYRQKLFKKDSLFEQKIPNLKEAFAWLMIQYFPTYTKDGLEPPQVLKYYMTAHWRERERSVHHLYP
jgi:phage/plasmid-associated DNA primase